MVLNRPGVRYAHRTIEVFRSRVSTLTRADEGDNALRVVTTRVCQSLEEDALQLEKLGSLCSCIGTRLVDGFESKQTGFTS